MGNSNTLAQAGRFSLVGIFNTALDLILFNIFRKALQISAVRASFISSTIAMIVSFFLNKFFVFASRGITGIWKQALYFFPATIFSIYIIHNGTIWILTNKWRWPLTLALKIVRALPGTARLSDAFVTDNVAKLAATALSLVSNFVLYKFFVFP